MAIGSSTTVGLLRVLLSANTAEFETGMKRATSAAYGWQKELRSVGRNAQAVGAALTKTLTLPILAAGAGLLKVGADFDRASDSIRAATGKTGADLAALNTHFKNVFKTVPASTDQVATAIGDLNTRTGATGRTLEGLATQILNLSRVGKADLQPLIAATTRAFGDWSISTERQSGALDFLWKTSQTTGIGVTRLTELVVQFGAPMRALGFSFEEAAALMGKWEKEGVNLETVLAGLRFALGNFAKAGREPADALREVQAAILGAKTESEATAIAFQTFGKRAAVDMSRAIIEGRFNIDELVASLKTSKETINSAAADTLSLSERITLLRNRVMAAVEPLAGPFVNALESAAKAAEPLIRFGELAAKFFVALPQPIQTVAIGLLGLAAAIGPVTYLFGQLSLAGAAIVSAFTKKGIVTRLLVGDLDKLGDKSITTSNRLRALGTAAAGAAAFFVGWQIGRLIAELTGLDQKIADVITREKELRGIRAQAAQGSQGLAAIQDQLVTLQQRYNEQIKAGNGQAAAYYAARIKAIQTDHAYLAIQDTIHQAIRQGADANITYAQAIEFNNQKAKEHAARLGAQRGEQQRTTGSTKALTDAMDGLNEKIRQADTEIAQLSSTARDKLAQAIKSGVFSMEDLQKASGLSEFAIKRFEESLKKSVRTTKDAETAAQKLEKQLEKQRDALQKLGVVTEDTVNRQLAEYAELVKLAADAGVPMDRILTALLPKLAELKKQADASGISVRELNRGFEDATRAAQRLTNDALARLMAMAPRAVSGLAQIPGTVIDIDMAAFGAAQKAKLLTESFHHFGLKTREELQETARQAKVHFDFLLRSGTATPEQIAEAFKKMQQAIKDASGEAQTFGQILSARLNQVLLDMPQTIVSALTGGGGFAGAAKAIASQIGSAIGGSIGGKIGGPVGEKIGAALGSLLGPLTEKFFKTESKKINDFRDEFLLAFGPSGLGASSGFHTLARQLHALGAEGDAVFRRLINASNQKEWEKAVKDVNKALDEQRTELARLSEQGGVASKQMVAWRDATRETAETLAFLKAETNTAATSFTKYLQSGSTAFTKIAELKKTLAEITAKDTPDLGDEDRKRLADERARVERDLKEQQRLAAAVGISSQQAATGMGAALAATFAELRNQGLSSREAILQLEPAIAAFRTQLEATGFTGGAAFDEIARLAGIATSEIGGPALEAIGQLGRGLEAAHNAGFLTQEMFEGLVGQIMHSRQALLDQGVAAEDVNRLMQKELQSIWMLQKDFGFQVDDATQKLIDEAEASGLVGDQYRSAMDRAAKAMERVADALERVIGKARGLGSVLDEATKPRTVKIDIEKFRLPEDTPIFVPYDPGAKLEPASGASRGGRVTAHGIQYRGLGGPIWKPLGTDTVPVMATPGELVLTEAQQGTIAEGLRAAASLIHSGAIGALPRPSVRLPRLDSTTARPAIFRGNIYLDQFGRVKLTEVVAEGIID